MNLFFLLYIIDILRIKKYKNLVNKKATYVSGFFIKGIWWGWRQLNKINKLLFIDNKNIIEKLGIQTGIQIMCC